LCVSTSLQSANSHNYAVNYLLLECILVDRSNISYSIVFFDLIYSVYRQVLKLSA
uniref:Uncharacterized protein n=1 Tax=Ciona intestinalis TaxID=7719 RepID=H2Y020_CIOIN